MPIDWNAKRIVKIAVHYRRASHSPERRHTRPQTARAKMIKSAYYSGLVKLTNKRAGAELRQAQVKLEVIVDVVEEAWS